MEYGIIHYGTATYHNLSAAFPTCSIAVEHPNDIQNASGAQPEDLFQFVKNAFKKQKRVTYAASTVTRSQPPLCQ